MLLQFRAGNRPECFSSVRNERMINQIILAEYNLLFAQVKEKALQQCGLHHQQIQPCKPDVVFMYEYDGTYHAFS